MITLWDSSVSDPHQCQVGSIFGISKALSAFLFPIPWFPWFTRTHGTQGMVMSVVMIYFSERLYSKIHTEKRQWGQNQKKPVVTFQSLPLESHERLLTPPALSCDNTREMLSTQEALLRLDPRVFMVPSI